MPTKYGIKFRDHLTDVEMELTCFRENTCTDGGLGSYRHLKNSMRLVLPDLAVHPWMEWRLRSLCEEETNVWAGAASCGKTFDAGLFAMMWWLSQPLESSVVLTSTTGKSIRRRIWPVIQELFYTAARIPSSPLMYEGFPGNMVDSKTTLQAKKGDDKHCIAAIAVAEGPVSKALSDIKGFHPKKRMLLIIDEANDTPEAIFHSISNLRKGLDEFKLLVIGNPVSRFDPHGLICEPVYGWNSVTVEDEEWPTQGVKRWEIKPGVCLHFDGLKSPNVVGGARKWPFLISQEDIDHSIKANHGENTLGFWSFTRGFWPPDGVCSTVFSEALLHHHDAGGQHVFYSKSMPVGGLDPSFTATGDGCILRLGLLGDLEDGRLAVQLVRRIKLPIRSGEDIYYQIANRTREECMSFGMEPRQLGVDVTGAGKGVADILCRTWGPGIHRVEFGAGASDLPVSREDGRKAADVYADLVTELWYICREFLVSDLLKGIDAELAKEFCTREIVQRGRKIQIKPKAECKRLLGHSPDDADATVVLLDVARHLGAVAASGKPSKSHQNWMAWAKKMDEVYHAIGSTEQVYEP